jgi:hypothetical protein
MRKIILFRISSKGYPKVRVQTLNKYDCLSNLRKVFSDWEFICVADNCDQALLDNLKQQSFDQFYETSLGNPGSFWFLYETALNSILPDDVVYFVEDDYLHLSNAPQAILEGLDHFDYVTAYDHLDKYSSPNHAVNPYAKRNQYSENTQLVHGNNFLWRISNSTTMTFAIKGKTLKEDADIWSMTANRKGDFDFEIFTTLTHQPILWRKRYLKFLRSKLKYFNKPKRYLGVCIPGLSLHLEIAYITSKDIERFAIPT